MTDAGWPATLHDPVAEPRAGRLDWTGARSPLTAALTQLRVYTHCTMARLLLIPKLRLTANSPYDPSTADGALGDNGNLRRLDLWARCFLVSSAGVQLILGLCGFFGVYLYVIDSPDNHSRYQALLVPMWMFLFSITFFAICGLLYRDHCRRMSRGEKMAFALASLFPLFSVIAACAV